ncbi:TolC family protein [Phormidium sp. CCY1219]|uniref:TolC family protein n=1 Tax=Phormidium sp. CCY1219 TaxID=2886104 RepID=UPI002D1F84FF|nr:TolC family protein [Phormidium sp. CCY1219]MEB3828883.1 TolC family protein [Phormidium sp. CCY1219]
MRTFRHLMAVGVGTLIALGDMDGGLSQIQSDPQRPKTQSPETLSPESVPLEGGDSVPVAPPGEIAPASPGDRQPTGAIRRDRRENHISTPESEPFLQAQGNRRWEEPPDYLTPSSNPLEFPTQPADVEIVGTQPVTLEEALDLAGRNSQELQEALLNLEQSRAALREARATLYPNLDLRSTASVSSTTNVELSNERARAQFGDNANEQDETSTAIDGTVELSYNLYTSGRRPAQIRVAEAQVRLNELQLEQTAAQLRLDVRDAYYNLQEADDSVRINLSAVESAQQSLQDAQALERAGLGTRFDVLRARVQLADAEQALTQARSQQRIRRRELAEILNVSPVVNLSAAEEVEIEGIWNLSLEESIVLALKNRAELEQLLVQREISEQQRELALANNGPQVSLFANYNVLEVLDDERNLADGYALGGRLQWNLYDGGAARARAAQEEKNIEIAETRFAQLRNQIRLQVEQAFFNLRSNFENIQTANVSVEQAKESLRLARLRFSAGVGTQSDVLDAETELTRAQNNRLQAIVRYNRALAAMERAITNLDGGFLSDVP